MSPAPSGATDALLTALVTGPGGAIAWAVWNKWSGRKKEGIDLAAASLGVSEQVTSAAYALAQKESARADRAEARYQQAVDRHEAELAERDQKITDLRAELDRLAKELEEAQASLSDLHGLLVKTQFALDSTRAALAQMAHHEDPTTEGTPA